MSKENINYLVFEGLTVSIYRSPRDQKLVVELDGPENDKDLLASTEPDIRIWLNEALIYREGEVGDDLQ